MTRTTAPSDTRARSTPVVPSAFLNDHASDDDSFRCVPRRPFKDRTISNASISEENYFFEWTVWLGFAIYNLAFWDSGGAIALAGQGIILASIFGVTGIPPTENQAIQSKGEAYRQYQRRVSKFFPLPPKRT